MKGKRIVSGLLLAALTLPAFDRPPVPRSDPDAKVVFQFLSVVKENGSAEFHYIFKNSKEQIEQNLQSGNYSEDEICRQTTSDFEGYLGVFSQEAHGEEIWCRYKVEMDTLAGLRNRYRRDFMDLTVQRLEIEDGEFYLDLSWSQFPCTRAYLSDFICEWTVEMPGKVGPNNATRVDGRAVTWDMTAPDIPFHFQAESAVGASDSKAGIVLVILLSGCCMVFLTAAAGAAAFFFLHGRKQAPVESGRAAADIPPPASISPSRPPSGQS